jgi:hypothetical protein
MQESASDATVWNLIEEKQIQSKVQELSMKASLQMGKISA